MPVLRIPVLLKDRDGESAGSFDPFERRRIEVESLLPGPVSDRVAIVDLRADATLAPALPLPAREADLLPETREPYREGRVIRWSAFATVLETLALFEDEGCLGRRIPWAFGRSQLLVVPEAGCAANAFYHRESGSLQFFSYEAADGQTAHTAASHDVVAHETGHAILDGIAPWLYDASSPQSLATHESVADLTALFAAASSKALVTSALEATGGDLGDTWLFSSIARELGRGIGRGDDLRSLVDPDPAKPETLSEYADSDPHDLSVILSRAFYALLLDVYEARMTLAPRPGSGADALHIEPPKPEIEAESSVRQRQYRAVYFAVQVVKRLLFRGLDYLPPADVGFLDVARAVLACDRAAFPEDTSGIRALLEKRLVEREIGSSPEDLETPFEAARDALGVVDLAALRESGWHAMRLVEANREALGVPSGVPFDVLPRLHVRKKLHTSEGLAFREEVLLKIAWREEEAAAAIPGMPGRRWVRQGATVAFDADGRVCAWIRTGSADQREARDRWLARLHREHLLAPASGRGDSRHPGSPVAWTVSGGAFELHGAARALHLAGEAQ